MSGTGKCLNIPEDKIIDFNIPDPGMIYYSKCCKHEYKYKWNNYWYYPYSEKIGDDTEYDYTQVVSITTGSYEFKNNYDLRTFPFDKQKLIFKLLMLIILIIRIDYKTYTARALDNYVKNGTLNGWDIKGYEIKNLYLKDQLMKIYVGLKYQ